MSLFSVQFILLAVVFSVFAEASGAERHVVFANPASNQTQQSFLRVVNRSSVSGLVTVSGIDDVGNPAPGGDLTFTLGPNEATQFNSLDYEKGNTGKGLKGALGDGAGKWRLLVTSRLNVEVMSLIRTPDGFVTSVTDVVPVSGADVNEIYFANPASNQTQQGFVRVVNTSAETGLVTVSGIDDAGNPAPGGDITFTLGPNEAKQFNSLDYENGNAAKGLTGALGNGTGKWRMSVTSPLDLEVMSLIRTPDGFLTNLSGVTPIDAQGNHRIYFANPADNVEQQSFIRVVNTADAVGTVTIAGVDDNGTFAPRGDVQFDLGPFESKNMNAQDLEFGNPEKGLSGALGDGSGRWQLTVSSTLTLQVMNLIRTADGFVTNLSRLAPKPSVSINDVWFVNPGSNDIQRSFLRIINRSGQVGNVTIVGIDDAGNLAPGGDVTLVIGAFAAKEVTAVELENGNVGAGLIGALGQGSGKWHLSITADVDLAVMSLLDTFTGFLTNLSTVLPPPTTVAGISELLANDGAPADQFGDSVALDGDTALIGARLDDDHGSGSGSAYVFTLDGTAWTQQQKLTPADAGPGDVFGDSVALDNHTALIGASSDADNGLESGSAYVFTLDGTAWTQQQKLIPSDGDSREHFGDSVALDGTTALISASLDANNGPQSGAVYVFTFDGTSWSERQKLTPADATPGDHFGHSITLDGNTALIGSRFDDDKGNASGSVYVFAFDGTIWTQQQKLTAADGEPGDSFGRSVVLKGNTALIGAPLDDDNGNNSGSAYVFTFDDTIWSQQQKLTATDGASEDEFGSSIALDGNMALIGAPESDAEGVDSGATYLFSFDGSAWSETVKLLGDDHGTLDLMAHRTGVALDGANALVGAPRHEHHDVDSGAAYVFLLDIDSE